MLTRSEERLLRGLGRRRTRSDSGLFLAEGIRVVEELLEAGHIPRLAVVSPALAASERGAALETRLAAAGPIRRVPDRTLKRLAGTRSPQGVLAVATIPAADLDARVPTDPSTVVVLDAVQDPGNIGTLVRSAAAFGCELVAALPGTADPWNPKSVRASAGALFRLTAVETGADALWDWLEKHGFEIIGADAGGTAVDRGALPPRLALVVGNEGAGIGEEARRRCQRLVSVPMRSGTESLNVAVATGILLYELTRGRE